MSLRRFVPARLSPALVLLSLCVPFVACAPRTDGETQVVLEARLSGELVISQVYGGGGNSGATYRNDFIEIFNRSAAPVSLAGLSVQYASAAGNFQTSAVVALPNTTLAAGQYFLVALAGGATGAALPTADASSAAINMSGTAGKVALVDGTTAVPCTSGVCTLTNVIDLVGYGATASQFEGAGAATAPSNNTTSVQRRGTGCTESDDNRADFETPVVAVNPRNTATAVQVCATGGTDAGQDVAADVAADTGTDAPVDAAMDAGVDVVAPMDVVDAATTNPTGLVISQVYGGGGNSGAAYTNDYVELFNRGTSAVSLRGLSIQYASAAGNFNASGVVALPDVVVEPGRYFLVSLAGGTTGGTLPAADLTNTMVNLGASAGRVALVNGTTAIPCTSGVCTQTDVVDYVGYGATASEYEGTGPATAATMAAESSQRRGAGCIDTNDNRADFENPALMATPRNSATPVNDCSIISVDAGTDAGAPDVAMDAGADAGGGFDAGTDVEIDAASPDATTDTGVDSGSTGTDASIDTGIDAGPIDAVGLVISQVYGAGGNSGAAFTNDFVELFNRSNRPIALRGLSLQYASSAGTFQASGVTALPDATVAPGAYFLVQLASGGTAGSALPGMDHTNTAVNLSGSAGKVAIVIGTTALGCSTASTCNAAAIVDLVGYGSAATYFEGSGPATGPSGNITAAQRRRAGCVDTDDNAADFESTAPMAMPRWSGSPINDCTAPFDAGVADAGRVDSGTDVTTADVARDTGTDVVTMDANRVDATTDAAMDAATDVARNDVSTVDVPRVDVLNDVASDARDASTDARADATSRDATGDTGGSFGNPGCSCSTVGGTRSSRSSVGLLGGVVALAFARRRRRGMRGADVVG